MKILLVDNDQVYLNLLAEILTLYSHTVVKAPDGEAAMDYLKSQSVDLVISDVSMPRMNGMALHTSIRQDARLSRIPFAWNSSYRELRDLLHVSDPAIDFNFDKSMALPNLLYFINHLDTSNRLKEVRSSVSSILSRPDENALPYPDPDRLPDIIDDNQ